MENKDGLFVKIAQTSSSLGAGILGLGLGIWLFQELRAYYLVFIVAGLILHLFGMLVMKYDKAQLDTFPKLWKYSFISLFWICIVLLVFIAVSLFLQ